MSAASRSSRPWLIHYFQRHSEDDAATAVPAMDFLASLPPSVEAEFGAVLEAVAAAPPPAFSGGGKWEAMHGDMAGMYEVRISSSAAYLHLCNRVVPRDHAELHVEGVGNGYQRCQCWILALL